MMRARWYLASLGIVLLVLCGWFVVVHARAWFSVATEYLRYGYVLSPHVERRTAMIDGELVSLLFIPIQDDVTWGFANDPSAIQSVHEWRGSLNASVVINGAYFTETQQPAGYFSIDGNANMACPIVPDVRDAALGYTFAVWITDGLLEFGSTVDHPEICGGPDVPPVTAFTSFPTLVYQDATRIEKDSELKARRTMLAETVDGVKSIVITESGELTLYDAAQWFLAQHEEYAIVGNLDGGQSTGLSMRGERWNIEIPSSAVPNVIWGR